MQFTACTEVTEQQFEEKSFPTGPVYDEYESDPGRAKKKRRKN
jgi:hypothetical protein